MSEYKDPHKHMEVKEKEMTVNEHTPEPWKVEGVTIYSLNKHGYNRFHSCVFDGEDDNKKRIKRSEQKANANRIVSCVNTLAGIPNVEEWMEKVRESVIKALCSMGGQDYFDDAKIHLYEALALFPTPHKEPQK